MFTSGAYRCQAAVLALNMSAHVDLHLQNDSIDSIVYRGDVDAGVSHFFFKRSVLDSCSTFHCFVSSSCPELEAHSSLSPC